MEPLLNFPIGVKLFLEKCRGALLEQEGIKKPPLRMAKAADFKRLDVQKSESYGRNASHIDIG